MVSMDIDYAQAQENVTSVESSSNSSFLLRNFMGRPVLVRPDSKFLPALNTLSEVAKSVGRDVHVYVSPASLAESSEGSASLRAEDEPDEFYDFTPEDYQKVVSSYGKRDTNLKTRKMREEEESSRRAHITKATIRVQFPDNVILEAVFQPSEPVSMLHELLSKVLLKSDVPFYLFTTPPKERLKDLQQDMYSAGLAPGALVHFSHEAKSGQGEHEGPYLRPEIAALKDLHLVERPSESQEAVAAETHLTVMPESTNPVVPETRRESKRPVSGKPKWFKQR